MIAALSDDFYVDAVVRRRFFGNLVNQRQAGARLDRPARRRRRRAPAASRWCRIKKARKPSLICW